MTNPYDPKTPEEREEFYAMADRLWTQGARVFVGLGVLIALALILLVIVEVTT